MSTVTNPAPLTLTPEELEGIKRFLALNMKIAGHNAGRLITTLEAAWAENEKLKNEIAHLEDQWP